MKRSSMISFYLVSRMRAEAVGWIWYVYMRVGRGNQAPSIGILVKASSIGLERKKGGGGGGGGFLYSAFWLRYLGLLSPFPTNFVQTGWLVYYRASVVIKSYEAVYDLLVVYSVYIWLIKKSFLLY
jgi:hypothetical protein